LALKSLKTDGPSYFAPILGLDNETGLIGGILPTLGNYWLKPPLLYTDSFSIKLSTSSSFFKRKADWLSSTVSSLNFSLNLIFPGLITLEGRFALTPELKTGFDNIELLAGYCCYCAIDELTLGILLMPPKFVG
jgi:hypothetical protein